MQKYYSPYTFLSGKNIMRSLCLTAAMTMTIFASSAQTEGIASTGNQEVLVITPLFEYPTAPESLTGLEEKADWLVERFWDKLDTKNQNTVDQHALNDAFRVWITPMQWASREKTISSTFALLKRLEKNPALLIQFTKAAEDNLYDVSRAGMLIDEVYVKFAEAINKNKKIDNVRKARYKEQAAKLRATMPGSTAPRFSFVTPKGEKKEYFPMSTFTIIEFGDPTCEDCRMAKLKMDVNLSLAELVEKGLVNILFILPDTPEGWEEELAGYPARWTSGASEDVDDIYDIRLTPTFYTVGSDGKIISKNITVDTAIRQALEAATQNRNDR